MTDRTTLSLPDDTVERLEAHKRDGESWPAFADRVANILDDTDSEGEHAMNTLPPGVVDDLAAEISRRTADEVENRLTRR